MKQAVLLKLENTGDAPVTEHLHSPFVERKKLCQRADFAWKT